jgi:hypothetical protein
MVFYSRSSILVDIAKNCRNERSGRPRRSIGSREDQSVPAKTDRFPRRPIVSREDQSFPAGSEAFREELIKNSICVCFLTTVDKIQLVSLICPGAAKVAETES